MASAASDADPLGALPTDLQAEVLSLAKPWPSRGTCKSLLRQVEAGQRVLHVRWSDVPADGGTAAVQQLLGRLTHLHTLSLASPVPPHTTPATRSCPAHLLLSLVTLRCLTDLDLSYSPHIVDASPLSGCLALRKLRLRECTSLVALPSCGALTHLDLTFCCGVTDISAALAACAPSLTALDLTACRGVVDLSVLTTCAAMRRLSLKRCNIFSLKGLWHPLAGPALEALSLADCQKVRDLSPLTSCVALQLLDLSDCRGLQDLSPLSACTSLRLLDLSACRGMTSCAALGACNALEHLKAFAAPVHDVRALSKCVTLKYLDLANTRVSDLRPLASCTALTRLHLDDCPITDLRPLCESSSAAGVCLTHLGLPNCPISDVGPLARCVALQRLDLSGTLVAHLQPLAACTALQRLDLKDRSAAAALDLSALPARTRVTFDEDNLLAFDTLFVWPQLSVMSLAVLM